jgi:hypothetical protein
MLHNAANEKRPTPETKKDRCAFAVFSICMVIHADNLTKEVIQNAKV